jgi:uncharacterized membrane protein YqjE
MTEEKPLLILLAVLAGMLLTFAALLLVGR